MSTTQQEQETTIAAVFDLIAICEDEGLGVELSFDWLERATGDHRRVTARITQPQFYGPALHRLLDWTYRDEDSRMTISDDGVRVSCVFTEPIE